MGPAVWGAGWGGVWWGVEVGQLYTFYMPGFGLEMALRETQKLPLASPEVAAWRHLIPNRDQDHDPK